MISTIFQRHPRRNFLNFVRIGARNKNSDGNEESWVTKYRYLINRLSRDLSEQHKYVAAANSRNIERNSWVNYVASYRRNINKDPVNVVGNQEDIQKLRDAFDRVLASSDFINEDIIAPDFTEYFNCREFFFDMVLQKAEVELKEEISAYAMMTTTSDLRVPHEWYPVTRLRKRKIIYHGGPTNSGKVRLCVFEISVCVFAPSF
jgi:hypothetical protein